MLGQARKSAPLFILGGFSLPQEILGRSDCSESQPLVTNPRYGCSYRAEMEKKLRLGLVWGQRSGAMGAQIATANFREFHL